jgi:acid-sensing ion channel, other
MKARSGERVENSSRKSKSVFAEYAETTTIHGVCYVGDPNRLWIEKLFWVFVIIVSGYLCTVVILDSWKRWNDNQVIVSFDSKNLPVDEIPFPAVTICPEAKTNPKLYQMAVSPSMREFETFNETTADVTEALMKVCDTGILLEWYHSGRYMSADHIIKLLKKVAPTFEHTFLACGFGGSEVTFENCRNFFTEIITSDGVCYTFNMLNASEIFTEQA